MWKISKHSIFPNVIFLTPAEKTEDCLRYGDFKSLRQALARKDMYQHRLMDPPSGPFRLACAGGCIVAPAREWFVADALLARIWNDVRNLSWFEGWFSQWV
ncbi:hypothetical protein CEXT_316021 [Caerostris extrusa]|uniref:Uncharacterized protein n=1 Tax=Caerostris extrusa TaxID=172846 RepID=A0AAV4SIG6_CAEEX|nr:hypothetical protein CEXT_316021 [Caerostris extrusa]